MEHLINVIKHTLTASDNLPFAVYHSVKEQRLLNVPIVKPLFIAVLDGDKALGKDDNIMCHTGDFIFLSDSPAIDMRNIPKDKDYFALLIEFEPQDFIDIETSTAATALDKKYCVGELTEELIKCLQQFVEWSAYAPQAMWSLRRKELIQLLCHLGHAEILSMSATHKLSQKIFSFISKSPAADTSLTNICQHVAMSESTVRRKLTAEGTSVQEIKDQVKLGYGLHLLQTTQHAISYIAEQCGYQSQSRFTDRFKQRFGLTPSALKNTK